MRGFIILFLFLTACTHGEQRPVEDFQARDEIAMLTNEIRITNKRIDDLTQAPILEHAREQLREVHDALTEADIELRGQQEHLDELKRKRRR